MKSIIKLANFFVVLIFLSSCGRQIPEGLGVKANGMLSDCPDSPNCVSTQTKKEQATINPITYKIEDAAALLLLKELLEKDKLATVIKEENNYLHVAYYTKRKVFIDDVEFLQDIDKNLFHFRSASRVGHSDLGANRKRMEKIQKNFEEQEAALK